MMVGPDSLHGPVAQLPASGRPVVCKVVSLDSPENQVSLIDCDEVLGTDSGSL